MLTTITFVVSMLGMLTIGEMPNYSAQYIYKIPFGNLFLPFSTPEMTEEYRPRFVHYFIVTAAFSILWGFLVPFFQKKPSYRGLMALSAAIWIPAEILFMLLCYFSFVYPTVFDTGYFIVLFAGISLGWLLFHWIGRPMAKGKKG